MALNKPTQTPKFDDGEGEGSGGGETVALTSAQKLQAAADKRAAEQEATAPAKSEAAPSASRDVAAAARRWVRPAVAARLADGHPGQR